MEKKKKKQKNVEKNKCFRSKGRKIQQRFIELEKI